MPFTFSHAAIVLPLAKSSPRYWSITGLVVGSMAPDLEYFTRMKILATYGHLWLEGLWFNVLIALIYCFVYHLGVRNGLINHLPDFLKARFISLTTFDWVKHFKNNWLIILVSIIIGIYSHLLWDAFTHEWGFFVKQIAVLQKTWFSMPIAIKGYKFLQYFSSVVGLIYIAFKLFQLPQKELPQSDCSFKFWMITILMTLSITGIRFYFFPIKIMTGNIIVVPIMALWISLILMGWINQNIKQKPQA